MSLYQTIKLHWKKPEFILMFIFIAVNIGLSYGQTKQFAAAVGAQNPFHQAAFSIILEGLFAFTLLTRADQRAQGLHVPLFLHIAYFGLLGAITTINITVLYQYHPIAGPFLGLVVAGTMLYTEKLFVWKSTEANKPARKKPRDLLKEAKKEIEEEQTIQLIEYLKHEARKPGLNLIKRARKDERKRRRVEKGQSIWSIIFPWWKGEEEQELPEYFRIKKEEDPIEQIQIELERTKPKVVDVEVDIDDADVQTLPARRIGFHAEDERRVQSSVQSSVQSVQSGVQSKKELAYKYALHLYHETNEVPSCRKIVQYSEQIAENTGQKEMKVSVGTAKTGRDQLIKELEIEE